MSSRGSHAPVATALARRSPRSRRGLATLPSPGCSGVWEAVAGEMIAAHATVVAEHAGVLEIVCDESVWAAELELMGPDLVERLNAALAESWRAVVSLRCRTGAQKPPIWHD